MDIRIKNCFLALGVLSMLPMVHGVYAADTIGDAIRDTKPEKLRSMLENRGDVSVRFMLRPEDKQRYLVQAQTVTQGLKQDLSLSLTRKRYIACTSRCRSSCHRRRVS